MSSTKSSLDIKHPSVILVNGRARGGKSTFIKTIMYKYRNYFDYGICFSNTAGIDGNFNYLDLKFTHLEYNENVLKQLMDLQGFLKRKEINKKVFIIFDDILGDHIFKSRYFIKICTQFAHYNATVILSTQHCNSVSSLIRSNAIYVAIFQSTTEVSIKAIFQSYGQSFETYNDFKNYMNQNTGNYNFIWVNTTSGEQDLNKKYEKLRCPTTLPNFKIKTNLDY